MLSYISNLYQDVQGYYECAYSRFVDIVCESVHFEIFFTCRNKLVKAMREEFCLEENDGKLSLDTNTSL